METTPKGTEDGSKALLETTLPKGTRERQRKEGQGASYLQPRCAADFLVRGRSSGRNGDSAAGRRLLGLAGSA